MSQALISAGRFCWGSAVPQHLIVAEGDTKAEPDSSECFFLHTRGKDCKLQGGITVQPCGRCPELLLKEGICLQGLQKWDYFSFFFLLQGGKERFFTLTGEPLRNVNNFPAPKGIAQGALAGYQTGYEKLQTSFLLLSHFSY